MFDDYRNYTTIIIVDTKLDKLKVVQTCKELLYYYLLLQQFTRDDAVHIKYERLLINELRFFTRNNPTFGRKRYGLHTRRETLQRLVRRTQNRPITRILSATPDLLQPIQNVVFPRSLLNTSTQTDVSNTNIPSSLLSTALETTSSVTSQDVVTENPIPNIRVSVATSPNILNVPTFPDSFLNSPSQGRSIPTSIETWVNNHLPLDLRVGDVELQTDEVHLIDPTASDEVNTDINSESTYEGKIESDEDTEFVEVENAILLEEELQITAQQMIEEEIEDNVSEYQELTDSD